MRKLTGKNLAGLMVLAGLLVAASAAAAQEATAEKPPKPAKPLSLYRLEFAIHESEAGQRINTRRYSQLVEEGTQYSTLRAGAKMPITRGGDVLYMDVGVRLDYKDVTERDGHVAFELVLEITSFAQDQQPGERPLLRNISANVLTAVPLGKPTVVSSIDDAASKRRYELEVTATKVK